MTNYELISILASVIACVISLNNWFGQRKLQQESNDLQRATSELAKKQLEIILREEKDADKSHIALDLIRDGNTYRFRITNVSNVVAKNVNLELILNNQKDNPIPQGEYVDKLPIKMLPPGGSVTLIAALNFSTPTSYNALLRWTNPNGDIIEEETFVSL
ncbi:TPA: hypothetical protein JL724_001153 [Legionella pneumophila]|nr:hypothetical protein [Legionella pneumophila]HAU1138397.1 hypothetical protein [Legionella pneumophila]HAW6245162.1 hypothetical protein [Legionella pneumophila]